MRNWSIGTIRGAELLLVVRYTWWEKNGMDIRKNLGTNHKDLMKKLGLILQAAESFLKV